MLKIYLEKIMNNDILLSIVLSVFCTMIVYFEHKRQKTIYSNINYVKLVLLISISIYLAIYLKNIKIQVKESSIKIGEPDF